MILKNFSSGVLATGIGTGDGTITAVAGSTLPVTAGTFTATIWDNVTYADPSKDPNAEIVLGVYASPNTYTITRAQESTSAVAHSAGAVVGLYLTAGALVQETDWTNYFAASTIVGWATKTGNIYVKKIGKTVFVNFVITGTSNATGITFTVPYTSVSYTVNWGGVLFEAGDNGSPLTTPCSFSLGSNSNQVNVYKDMYSTGWTASGGKTVQGQFWYESA